MRWFLKEANSPEKPDAKSLGIDPKSAVRSVYASSSKNPGKELTIAWKNTSQNSSSAKSPRNEIWGPVPWRDWKTIAICPKQGTEPCQKHVQAQRERQSYIPLARGRLGTPGCVNNRAGGKRVCGGSWGHGRVRRRPTARCKPEKKPRYMSKNWTYPWLLCFLKKLPQFFLSESSARIKGKRTTGPAVQNHISSTKARELIAKNQTVCQSQSLVYLLVPLQRPHQLHHHLRHRIPNLTSTGTPKIQHQKEVEVRGGATGKPAAWSRRNRKPKWRTRRSTSDLIHELPQELWGIWSMKEFPMDRNCDICLGTKKHARLLAEDVLCRRRAGTVVRRAGNFGDFITTDRKVLSEEIA